VKELILTLSLLFPAVVGAQATQVDPAINERFRNPDMEDLETTLEREDRNVYIARYAVVEALGLEAGDDVADVGAGTGFITRLMAEQVGPRGRTYAVEIAPEMVDHIVTTSHRDGLDNVVGVLGTDTETNLPRESIDTALVCYVYHHFEQPEASLASIRRALRSDGRLVVIDRHRIRGVTEDRRYYDHYRAGKGTFTDEIIDAGFELEKELPSLVTDSYALVFKKREQ
jgi:ubiquinone/menaquinone biosynthesis C-methylase UbiE